jgi:hypothetical protein
MCIHIYVYTYTYIICVKILLRVKGGVMNNSIKSTGMNCARQTKMYGKIYVRESILKC